MQKILAIIQKELQAYFKSPLAYIILLVMLSVFNIFFFMIIDQGREATLKDMFLVMEFMFVFLIPLLSMKMFSEEKFSGTIEFLLTSPVKKSQIVLGKYLGGVVFFTLLILLTSIYYFVIEFYGTPDRAEVLAGYVGIWLEGIFFIAVGMMCSSWTKNQIIAALNAYLILFLLYFSKSFVQYFDGYAEAFFQHLSTMNHAQNFFVGLIHISDVVYYLTGIFLCLTMTRLSIETRLSK